MDIPLLRAFIAAVEESSLSRAAIREDLVTSAISKRVADLERQAGVMLLLRHGRGVEPTPAGAAFYQRAKAVLRGLDLARDELAAYGDDGSARIRLAANPSTTVQFLPRDLSIFLRRHAETRVKLLEVVSRDIPRLVIEGEADLGIYHAASPAPGLQSFLYRRDHVCLVVSRGHAFAARREIAMEEALDHPFLGYFPRHSIEGFLDLAGHTLSRPPIVRSEIANYEARCRMVEEGLGFAVVPSIIARNYVATMRLETLALTDAWASRQMYLCVRAESVLSSAAARLLTHLRGCASAVSPA